MHNIGDQNPLVSIIVPVYNVENYLSECIESIINQDYENIELILVNDNSTDRSGDICEEYSSKHDNIITIHKKDNGGAGSSRNIGLDTAHGSYVMFVDSDDFIDCNMVSELYRALCKNSSDIAGSQLTLYDNGKDFKNLCRLSDPISIYNSESSIKMLFLRKLDCSPCTKLFKRNVIGSIRFIEGKTNEDVVFLFYVYLNCASIVYLSKSFYHYRINMQSVTKTFSKRNLDMYDNTELLGKEVCQLSLDVKDEFMSYKIKIAIDCCMMIITNSARKKFAGYYKLCRNECMTNFYKIITGTHYSYKYKCKLILILLFVR